MSLYNQPKKKKSLDPATKYKQGKGAYQRLLHEISKGMDKNPHIKGLLYYPMDKDGNRLTAHAITANEFMELMEKQRLASTPPEVIVKTRHGASPNTGQMNMFY